MDADALAHMTHRWAHISHARLRPRGPGPGCQRRRPAATSTSPPPARGIADILLVPTYEVGNGIGKAMSPCSAGPRTRAIILGAKVPVVLVSRADSAESKLASIALGAVTAGKV